MSFDNTKSDSEIHIDLLQLPLTESLEYCALSYVWGHQPRDKTIWINEDPVLVTQHLYNFLELARTQDVDWRPLVQPGTKGPEHAELHQRARPPRWWVDALCIDQTNIDERNEQVPRMGKIYSFADSVMIWLGTADEVFGVGQDIHELQIALSAVKPDCEYDRSSYFSELKRLVNLGEAQDNIHQSRGPESAACDVSDTDANTDHVDDSDSSSTESEFSLALELPAPVPFITNLLEQIRKLISNIYFTRGWIVQEFIQSQSCPPLLVGPLPPMHHKDIITARGGLGYCYDVMDEKLRVLLGATFWEGLRHSQLVVEWDHHHKQPQHHLKHPSNFEAVRLAYLLRLFCNQDYTLEHDRFYSLLGMFDFKDVPAILQPDYRLSFSRVSWNYARWIIEHTGDVRLVETYDSTLDNCPTWVPDLRHVTKIKAATDKDAQFAVGKTTVSLDGHSLRAEGARIGHVICCTCEANPTSSFLQRMAHIGKMLLDRAAQVRGESEEAIFQNWAQRFWPVVGQQSRYFRNTLSSIADVCELFNEDIDLDTSELTEGVFTDPNFVSSRLVTASHPNLDMLNECIHVSSNHYCLLDTGEIMKCYVGIERANHGSSDAVWAIKGASALWLLRSVGDEWSYHGTIIFGEVPLTEEEIKDGRLDKNLVMDEKYFSTLNVQPITLV